MNWTRQLMVAAVLATVVAPAVHAEDPGADLDMTRDTLRRWVETRRAVAREREDWRLGREILEGRISLLEGEIRAVEERLGEARDGLADVHAERDALSDRETELAAAEEVLREAVGPLEARLGRVQGGFPEPFRQRVAPLLRRLPDDPAVAEGSLAERWQVVLGVLNEADKFARDVAVASEIRELPDGTKAEVRTLHLGFGQSWFVTPNGDMAGFGVPRPGGTEWRTDASMAPAVRQALAIVEGDDVPAWVSLPVEVTP